MQTVRITMKSMILSALALMLISTQTQATEYACIAASLEATNSSIFYGLSNEDIDKLLKEENYFAVRASEQCEIKAREYKCVADKLEAYNSSMFYNLTPSEVEAMLSIPGIYGHSLAVDAVRNCDLRN